MPHHRPTAKIRKRPGGWPRVRGRARAGTGLGSYIARSIAPVSIIRPKTRTRCVERSWLRHTKGLATCEPCSCCSGTRSRESTVRYLGIEVDDALSISEEVELWLKRGSAPLGFPGPQPHRDDRSRVANLPHPCHCPMPV